INTFMTGEFFSLLVQKSILQSSVEVHNEFHEDIHVNRFLLGVAASGEGNILGTAFKVRMNDVLRKMEKKENYSYLSGLLIGTELRGSPAARHSRITVCCGSSLAQLYMLALEKLELMDIAGLRLADEAGDAFVRGQVRIFNHSRLLQ
ncbi:MAG TPA: 2-dehydro-3-deoxygalactonokinase, partial [Chitinophagaceae bacterium]|nr:2-dehydro-3-deoxygalactonokinase [Chitinophagaceae bacterium]